MPLKHSDPWDVFFKDLLPPVQGNISTQRPHYWKSASHNALNNLSYLLHIYEWYKNQSGYEFPFSIQSEIERYQRDVFSVTDGAIDLFQADNQSILCIATLLPASSSSTSFIPDYPHEDGVSLFQRLESWQKETGSEVNPVFMENFRQAAYRTFYKDDNPIKPIFGKPPAGIKQLPLQDAISFLNRECQSMLDIYGQSIKKQFLTDKSCSVLCKGKSPDEIVELSKKNDHLQKLIIKNPKDLGLLIEKYELIKMQQNALLDPAKNRQGRIEKFIELFADSHNKISNNRDPLWKRFAKICLFILASAVTLTVVSPALYNNFFTPKGDHYVNKVRSMIDMPESKEQEIKPK